MIPGGKPFTSLFDHVAQEESRKLKILCLHGYRQNEVTFREKLGAFRKLVGKRVDLVFFSSPVKVPLASEDEASLLKLQGVRSRVS